MKQVVLIEDEADLAEAIAYHLDRAGFAVRTARTGEEGLDAVRRGADLVLLDLNLPGMDGLEVCRLIRRQTATANVPVIVVSARAEEIDLVLGLEMGADDYVVKPFRFGELAARCKAALRRSAVLALPTRGYVDESFEVDFEGHVARYRGREVALTAGEFSVLRALVESPGRVVTRERLLALGRRDDAEERSVDATVRRLRAKLGEGRRHVLTVIGVGYRFVRAPAGLSPGTARGG